MSNPVRALLILVAMSALALSLMSARSGPDPSTSDARVGRAAPAFELPVLGTDERRALSDHAGDIVVLDFWATHCGPCRRGMPHVERLRERYADRGVTVLSVNLDVDARARDNVVGAFVRQLDIEADVLLDDGHTAYRYGANRIPLIVVVDREGVIRRVYQGYTEYGRLAAGVDALLEG